MQCHSALNRLKATVENVCELVAVGLDQSILEIKKLVLFQTEQVTWRGWQVNEFVANQKSFLQSETRELHLRVQSIEAALQVKTLSSLENFFNC